METHFARLLSNIIFIFDLTTNHFIHMHEAFKMREKADELFTKIILPFTHDIIKTC